MQSCHIRNRNCLFLLLFHQNDESRLITESPGKDHSPPAVQYRQESPWRSHQNRAWSYRGKGHNSLHHSNFFQCSIYSILLDSHRFFRSGGAHPVQAGCLLSEPPDAGAAFWQLANNFRLQSEQVIIFGKASAFRALYIVVVNSALSNQAAQGRF